MLYLCVHVWERYKSIYRGRNDRWQKLLPCPGRMVCGRTLLFVLNDLPLTNLAIIIPCWLWFYCCLTLLEITTRGSSFAPLDILDLPVIWVFPSLKEKWKKKVEPGPAAWSGQSFRVQTGLMAVLAPPNYKAGPIKGSWPPGLPSLLGWALWLSGFWGKSCSPRPDTPPFCSSTPAGELQV